MKVVSIDQAQDQFVQLLGEVERGEEVVIARDGKPVARLSQPSGFNRQPGILADSPAWKDFQYDPSIFAPLETDDELAAEGWPI